MELARAVEPLPAGSGAVCVLSSVEVLPVAGPFDRAMLEASRGTRVAVVVAAQGHSGARQSGRMAMSHYTKLGAEPFVVDVLEREQAETYILPECDILFFTGGSPRRLLRCFQDTPFWTEALQRWRDGMTLAGSSAGAMALCEHCLVPNPGDRQPTRWTAGLGPLANIGVAVHATSRSEQWLRSVAESARWPVVALHDATGVILRADAEPLVAGPGTVRVL
ncbi:MAG: hypothetical protein NVSMB57_10210 [Actinomycetota bacterium]